MRDQSLVSRLAAVFLATACCTPRAHATDPALLPVPNGSTMGMVEYFLKAADGHVDVAYDTVRGAGHTTHYYDLTAKAPLLTAESSAAGDNPRRLKALEHAHGLSVVYSLTGHVANGAASADIVDLLGRDCVWPYATVVRFVANGATRDEAVFKPAASNSIVDARPACMEGPFVRVKIGNFEQIPTMIADPGGDGFLAFFSGPPPVATIAAFAPDGTARLPPGTRLSVVPGAIVHDAYAQASAHPEAPQAAIDEADRRIAAASRAGG